jgi:uncharacterized protein
MLDKIQHAREVSPRWKRFSSSVGEHVFVVASSAVYDLRGQVADGGAGKNALEAAFDIKGEGDLEVGHAINTSPQSISLNVSSGCNLACTYCYAGRGQFNGAQPLTMTESTAFAAISRLLELGCPDKPFTIGFLGGEPLVNRRLVYRCVEFAVQQAATRNIDVRFSITTNGTLLEERDVCMFRRLRFAVTISVDGGPELQASMRPVFAINGKNEGCSDMSQRIAPLLANPGLAQIAARATVTRRHLQLGEIFRDIESLGFSEIGFAPLRSKRDADALNGDDWSLYLRELKRLTRAELARAVEGKPIRLSNFAIALKQIHRGYRSPYPCGAGGGYFSVSASGDWYACHRAIGNEMFRMGDSSGPQRSRKTVFLTQRHVEEQSECRACWARYLCSGGCHQEAAYRTDASCNAVREWLEFCLSSYVELMSSCPDFFRRSTNAR